MIFFDDILVFSKTWEEHLQHLEMVLSILEKESLYAKESKCEFGLTKLLYLGHIISTDGVWVIPERIELLLIGLLLQTSHILRGSLDFVGFIGDFLRDFHRMLHP